MLEKFTILNDTDKLMMIMRPYQVYATEALLRQATMTNRNAYIWHTTGAGKTLTSFKTAQLLASLPTIKKVIFLVDLDQPHELQKGKKSIAKEIKLWYNKRNKRKVEEKKNNGRITGNA